MLWLRRLRVAVLVFLSVMLGIPVQEATAQSAMPNLLPTEISGVPSTVVVDQEIDFDSGVRNVGDADSGVFNLKWLVDGNEVNAYGSHEGVPAGLTVLDGNSQFSHAFGAPGSHTVTFIVDVDNHFNESNEGDNAVTIQVSVEAPAPNLDPAVPPQFYCITGPGGFCLEDPSQIPSTSDWAPTPPEWLTSPVTGACVASFLPGLDLLKHLGGVIRWHDSGRKWYVLLTEAMPFKSCAELALGVFQPASNSIIDSINRFPLIRDIIRDR